ncbi:MAG: integrating conjugative element protein [Pseudomonadota bacterium]
MKKPKRAISACPVLSIISVLPAVVLLGTLLNSAASADDEFYYLLGGGEPFTRSASNRDTTIVLGGSVGWNTDLMCGNFDIRLSVEEQLQGVKGAFSDLMGNVINAATGAVASLPALVIQRVNPALYDLLQNGVLQAGEEFHIAQASCEDISDRLGDVISGTAWEDVSRGGFWASQSTSGAEIIETSVTSDAAGRDAGVIWVEGALRGGRGQPPIALVDDTAKAGYNMVLKRNPASTSSTTASCAGAAICEQWGHPQAFSDWMVAVVGEKRVRTCEGCDKVEAKAGMGLTHQVSVEQERIALEIDALVSGTSAPSMTDLDLVSGGPGMRITRRVIEAIREEGEHEQVMLINRLAGEMALALTMERAMIARRAMLAGLKEPNLANLEIAQEQIRPYVDELEQEIENILFEMDVRQRITSNTTMQLLARDRLRSSTPIVESVLESTFAEGATQDP